MEIHVHVYHVISKAEVDVDVKNQKVAMAEALGKVKGGKVKFEKSDCEYLAIVPGKKKTKD
jgi:translation initiation factor IF-1